MGGGGASACRSQRRGAWTRARGAQHEGLFDFEKEKLDMNDLRILIANDLFRLNSDAKQPTKEASVPAEGAAGVA